MHKLGRTTKRKEFHEEDKGPTGWRIPRKKRRTTQNLVDSLAALQKKDGEEK